MSRVILHIGHRSVLVAALFLLAFSAGCSSDIEELPTGTTGGAAAGPSPVDAPAQAGVGVSTSSQVTIGPLDATKSSRIKLKADRSLLYGGNIYWYVNDQLIDQKGGTRLSYRGISRGDVIKAVIVKAGGEEISSNELVIKNALPSIGRVDLLPKFPVAGVAPKVEVWGNDIDGDKVSFTYQWYVNNKPGGRWSVLEEEFTKNDDIRVEITPYDGLDYGKTLIFRPEIFNSSPVIVRNQGTFDGSVYKNQLVADDPDNDPLVFKLIEAPEGMKIDPPTGLITWPVVLESEETYLIKVEVSDGYGGSSLYAFDVRTLLEKPGGE